MFFQSFAVALFACPFASKQLAEKCYKRAKVISIKFLCWPLCSLYVFELISLHVALRTCDSLFLVSDNGVEKLKNYRAQF